MSVALENARLFEETRQRNAELALINDVQRGLAENLEMQAMYDLVGDRLQEIFDAQVVDIAVLDESHDLVHFPYILENGERLTRRADRSYRRPRSHVFETRESLRFDDHHARTPEEYGQPPRCWSGSGPSRCSSCRSSSAVEATGVISLQSLDRERAFSEADDRLLTTLAGSLSVALENARLFEETRQRNAELALINDVQRGLAENLEMQAMYDLVGDRLQEIFDAQVVDIGVLDGDSGLIRFPYTIERGKRFPEISMEVDRVPSPRAPDAGAIAHRRRGA